MGQGNSGFPKSVIEPIASSATISCVASDPRLDRQNSPHRGCIGAVARQHSCDVLVAGGRFEEGFSIVESVNRWSSSRSQPRPRPGIAVQVPGKLCSLLRSSFGCVLAYGSAAGFASAQTTTFDFDTAVPILSTGRNLPFTQTVGDLTAQYTAVNGAFSIQTDRSAGLTLSQFSGKYLYPNTLLGNAVRIQFYEELIEATVTFATTDHAPAALTPFTLLALEASALATNLVGSVTNVAVYGKDSFPQGKITFRSGSKVFNRLEFRLPTGAKTTYFIDNVTVTRVPRVVMSLVSTNSVMVSWPVEASGFLLQQNPGLDPQTWQTVNHSPEVEAGRNQVTISPATGTGFYRLVRP